MCKIEKAKEIVRKSNIEAELLYSIGTVDMSIIWTISSKEHLINIKDTINELIKNECLGTCFTSFIFNEETSVKVNENKMPNKDTKND